MRKAVLALLIGLSATPVYGDYRTESIEVSEVYAVEAMKRVWQIEAGGLTEGATEELLEEAITRMKLLPEDNIHRADLEVMAEEAEKRLSGEVWENCTLTAYCPGSCCCGQWASGYTASGTKATAGRTVAHNTLPFGTRVLIGGHEYIVEDRGDGNMDSKWFDIFFDTHQEALNFGMQTGEVTIIERAE